MDNQAFSNSDEANLVASGPKSISEEAKSRLSKLRTYEIRNSELRNQNPDLNTGESFRSTGFSYPPDTTGEGGGVDGTSRGHQESPNGGPQPDDLDDLDDDDARPGSSSDSGNSSQRTDPDQTRDQRDSPDKPAKPGVTIIDVTTETKATDDIDNINVSELFAGSRALRMSTWEGTRLSESSVPEALPPYPTSADDEETFRTKVFNYMRSSKGRDLSLSVTLGYAMCLAVFCFAIVLSALFTDDLIGNVVIQGFLGSMYALSIIALVILLSLGSMGELTTNNHYMHQKSTAFIRGGMLALGTGGILYRCTIVLMYVISDDDCRNDSYLVVAILGIIFTVLQMSFLMKYSKIEINKSLPRVIAARFLCMQIVATNLCLWVNIIIEETVHELHYTSSHDETTDNSTAYSEAVNETESLDGSARIGVHPIAGEAERCETNYEIQELLAPYLFALMIEFCVVASTMVIAIWEKCGQGIEEDETQYFECQSRDRNRTLSEGTEQSMTAVSTSQETDSDTSETPASRGFYSSFIGFIAGWSLIIFVFAMTVFCLYGIFADASFRSKVDEAVYGTSFIVALTGLVAIPVTMYQMSKLTFKDIEIRRLRSVRYSGTWRPLPAGTPAHKQLEKQLLSVCFLSLMTYRTFCIIAALMQSETAPPHDPLEGDEYILFFDSVLIIVMAGLQTVFCNWFAFHKRSTTERDLREKPGKQGLEFLRCLNFAMWFLNSFLLKNPEAKEDQIQVFGETAWVILANVFHPLAILFYFHSFICMAEIMHRSYTKKYIGLVRLSKQKRAQQAAIRRNNKNLSLAERGSEPTNISNRVNTFVF